MLKLINNFKKAFKHSSVGFKSAWRHQWAFRIELFILLCAIPCAFYLGTNLAEKALMISSVMLLPIAELFNSAIETVVNRIGFEHHELSGLAKDLASAAMVVVGINVLIIWGIIIFPRII